jgi:hypothetical protein
VQVPGFIAREALVELAEHRDPKAAVTYSSPTDRCTGAIGAREPYGCCGGSLTAAKGKVKVKIVCTLRQPRSNHSASTANSVDIRLHLWLGGA